MSYGKINEDTNYLMTCEKQPDSTWSDITDFVKDPDGKYYTHYINPNTPDINKSNIEDDRINEFNKKILLNETTVTYSPENTNKIHTFSASISNQTKLSIVYTKLAGQSDSSTVKMFDSNHSIVSLNKADVIAIFSLITSTEDSLIYS